MSTFMPRVRSAYRSFWDHRRAVRTLSMMEDALLKDIGIGRSEIHPAVYSFQYDGRAR